MINYIGLDFEASGPDPWDKHVPIEIGIALSDGSTYESRIGNWDWDEWNWSEEAFGVHGITQEELTRGSGTPSVWKADILAAAWLLDNGWRNRMWTIPVGFNVAGYDRQFITRWMPNLNRLLSYRSVDLGAICFTIGGDEGGYNAVKKNAKKYALKQLNELGVEENWHGALYDAQAALYAYEFLSGIVSGQNETK